MTPVPNLSHQPCARRLAVRQISKAIRGSLHRIQSEESIEGDVFRSYHLGRESPHQGGATDSRCNQIRPTKKSRESHQCPSRHGDFRCRSGSLALWTHYSGARMSTVIIRLSWFRKSKIAISLFTSCLS